MNIFLIKITAITSLFFLLGCASKTNKPSEHPPKSQSDPHGTAAIVQGDAALADQSSGAPFVAKFTQFQNEVTSGQTIDVVLSIQYSGKWRLPTKVSLQIPSGISLLKGQQNQTLEPVESHKTIKIEYRMKVDTVPTNGLVAIIDSQGNSGGAHAEPVFYFGVIRPAAPPAKADGPNVKIGGKNLGKAHKMD